MRIAGDLEVMRVDGQPRITKADSTVLISRELWDEIRAGSCEPWAHADQDTVTFRDPSQRFVYRVGPYLPEQYAYFAELAA
jgi:hypothetical protein